MGVRDYITGVQHLGLPTKTMDQTLKFYKDLGFEVAFSTLNGKNRVFFIKQKNLLIEIYEEEEVSGKPGAIDHVALDVTDIEETFECVGALGYKMLDTEIQFLPFWERGVKFFTIMGPNGEKVEFSQML